MHWKSCVLLWTVSMRVPATMSCKAVGWSSKYYEPHPLRHHPRFGCFGMCWCDGRCGHHPLAACRRRRPASRYGFAVGRTRHRFELFVGDGHCGAFEGVFRLSARPEARRLLESLGPLPDGEPVHAAALWAGPVAAKNRFHRTGSPLGVGQQCLSTKQPFSDQLVYGEVALGYRLAFVGAWHLRGPPRTVSNKRAWRPLTSPDDAALGTAAIQLLHAAGVVRPVPGLSEHPHAFGSPVTGTVRVHSASLKPTTPTWRACPKSSGRSGFGSSDPVNQHCREPACQPRAFEKRTIASTVFVATRFSLHGVH